MYAREDKKNIMQQSRGVEFVFSIQRAFIEYHKFQTINATLRCRRHAAMYNLLYNGRPCPINSFIPISTYVFVSSYVCVCVCNKKCMMRAHNSSSHSNHFLCCILYIILYIVLLLGVCTIFPIAWQTHIKFCTNICI